MGTMQSIKGGSNGDVVRHGLLHYVQSYDQNSTQDSAYLALTDLIKVASKAGRNNTINEANQLNFQLYSEKYDNTLSKTEQGKFLSPYLLNYKSVTSGASNIISTISTVAKQTARAKEFFAARKAEIAAGELVIREASDFESESEEASKFGSEAEEEEYRFEKSEDEIATKKEVTDEREMNSSDESWASSAEEENTDESAETSEEEKDSKESSESSEREEGEDSSAEESSEEEISGEEESSEESSEIDPHSPRMLARQALETSDDALKGLFEATLGSIQMLAERNIAKSVPNTSLKHPTSHRVRTPSPSVPDLNA